MTRNARLVRVDGVDLCVTAIGDESAAALVLIGGSGASTDWWEDDFRAVG